MVVIDLLGGCDVLVTEITDVPVDNAELQPEAQSNELHYETQLELVVVG